jgi:outer membrane protein OmpA-like peptidoglycan-associated protein
MQFFKRFNIFMLNENDTQTQQTSQPQEGEQPAQAQEPAQPADDKIVLKELKAQLDSWTSKYGSVFKFINAQPKTDTKDVKAAIMDENKAVVDEAIKAIVAILANEKFKDKVDTIEVVGHTSSTWGNADRKTAIAKNQALSEVRSRSVVKTIQAMGGNAIGGVKLVPTGKGLTERIIDNDAVEGTPTAGAGMNEVTNFPSLKNITNPEQKQMINRRVVIKLPTIPAQYEVVVDKVEKKPEPKKVTVPVAPKANSIQFNYDSYIPTKESIGILSSFAKQIAEYNKQTEKKITNVYICAHSHKGINEKKDEKRQEQNIFFISLNRAVMVKNVLASEAQGVNFHMIPVSFYQMQEGASSKDNKRVEIYFEQNEKVESAKKIYGKLASKYDVESRNGEYSGDVVLQNKLLRSDVIKNLNTVIENDVVHKFIPLELWYSKYGEKHEPNFKKFRDKIIRIAGNEEKAQKYVYDIK